MASAIGATFPVGHTVLVGPLQWDAHEVTIGQYAEFLQALKVAAPGDERNPLI